LRHGAERVLVVAQVEDARALAETLPGVLLVGERNEQCLPGFDLGNSPLDVLEAQPMDGRTVIFTSSNGAQRLTACRGADRLYVGTVSNATVLAECVRSYAEVTGRDVVLISAGKYPDESFISDEDDAACAYLAACIGLPPAEESRAEFERWQEAIRRDGLESIFSAARHAKRLDAIGLHQDVVFCARPDTLPILPGFVAPVLLEGREIGVELRPVKKGKIDMHSNCVISTKLRRTIMLIYLFPAVLLWICVFIENDVIAKVAFAIISAVLTIIPVFSNMMLSTRRYSPVIIVSMFSLVILVLGFFIGMYGWYLNAGWSELGLKLGLAFISLCMIVYSIFVIPVSVIIFLKRKQIFARREQSPK